MPRYQPHSQGLQRWAVRFRSIRPISFYLLSGIASCSASNDAYNYTFLRSVVCLSVCRLSLPCILLKPFNAFRRYEYLASIFLCEIQEHDVLERGA